MCVYVYVCVYVCMCVCVCARAHVRAKYTHACSQTSVPIPNHTHTMSKAVGGGPVGQAWHAEVLIPVDCIHMDSAVARAYTQGLNSDFKNSYLTEPPRS